MSDWREEPITTAQKRRMTKEGIAYTPSMTKGEASDLIGSTQKPNEEEMEILEFFKIKKAKKFTQTEARKVIDDIFEDRDNLDRWNSGEKDTSNNYGLYIFFVMIIILLYIVGC